MSDDLDDLLENDPGADDESTTTESTDTAEQATDGSGDVESDASVPETPVPNALTDSDEDELGHIVASEEIHVTRGDYKVNAFVKTDCRDDVRVGDYVQVPYLSPEDGTTPDELFAIVDGLRYEPYTELDDKSDTHNRIAAAHALDETEFVLVAELEPIAIVSPTDDGLDRGIVNKIPKPNTPVAFSLDQAYLRTGLNIPHEAYSPGICPSAATASKSTATHSPTTSPTPALILSPVTSNLVSPRFSVTRSSPARPGRVRRTSRRTSSGSTPLTSATLSRTTTPATRSTAGSTSSSSIRRTSTPRCGTATQNSLTSPGWLNDSNDKALRSGASTRYRHLSRRSDVRTHRPPERAAT